LAAYLGGGGSGAAARPTTSPVEERVAAMGIPEDLAQYAVVEDTDDLIADLWRALDRLD
jgi:hypothetical protein